MSSTLSEWRDLILSLEVGWKKKAGLVEWDTGSAGPHFKCYILEGKVCRDMGQSASL